MLTFCLLGKKSVGRQHLSVLVWYTGVYISVRYRSHFQRIAVSARHHFTTLGSSGVNREKPQGELAHCSVPMSFRLVAFYKKLWSRLLLCIAPWYWHVFTCVAHLIWAGVFEWRQPKDCSVCATMRDLGVFKSFLHFPLAFTFYDAELSSA